MLLAQIEPPSPWVQGDQILRTHQPCRSLADHQDNLLVVAGTWLSPLMQDVAQWADILVLVQAAWNDFLPLLARRRAAGLTTLFEINDNFRAIHPHTARGFWADPGNQALIMQLAHRADGLILSSPGLVERYAWLHPSWTMLPNQLETVPPWRAADWAAPDALVVGWAGSGGHRDDVLAAAGALRRVVERCPNVQVAIMSQQDILDIFDDWPAERLRRVPAGGYRHYLRFLDTIHVGVAPLHPTEFNQCRSDVKVIEYAAHSVVPVVEDCTPYTDTVAHGEDGLKMRGKDGLEAALRQLAGDPALARRLAHAAWHKVATGRQEHQHAGRRWQVLMAARQRAGAAPAPSVQDSRQRLMDAFRRMPTPAERPHPRFWQLHFGPTEQRLVELLGQAGGDEAAGREICQLAESDPSHPAAQLLAGRCATCNAVARDHLAAADQLLPWGCEAPFSEAHRWRLDGDLARTRAAYQRAAGRAPSWGLPHESLAHLALAGQDPDAAMDHLAAALAANPFNRRPAATLVSLAHRHGQPARAAALAKDGPALPQLVGVAEAQGVGRALLATPTGEGSAAAVAYLEWAHQALGPDATLQALLARAYLSRGQPLRARRLMRGLPAAAAPASG